MKQSDFYHVNWVMRIALQLSIKSLNCCVVEYKLLITSVNAVLMCAACHSLFSATKIAHIETIQIFVYLKVKIRIYRLPSHDVYEGYLGSQIKQMYNAFTGTAYFLGKCF